MIRHVLQEFVFPCVGSVKTSGTPKEACGNSYPQQRMFKIFIKTICSKSSLRLFNVSFFLVHLFYPFSFALIHSIKWIGNSTIISFSLFCEFDVSSTSCWILIRLYQCSQTQTRQILGWIGTWQTRRLE